MGNMTNQEIKDNNRRVRQMNYRNQKKLERLRIVLPEEKVTTNVKAERRCRDCGDILPEPRYEQREDRYSEQVTYCSCGAVYTD